jgi:hypothetical protein
MTKLLGQLATMTISVVTPRKYTTSTLMAVGLRKTRKRILDHLHKKEARESSTIGQTNIIIEGACQSKAAVTVEAHTHSSHHTACTMVVTPTIAQNTAQNSLSLKRRWSKTPTSLCINHRPEK